MLAEKYVSFKKARKFEQLIIILTSLNLLLIMFQKFVNNYHFEKLEKVFINIYLFI